jgi:Glutathione S-transferase, N-terminal domain
MHRGLDSPGRPRDARRRRFHRGLRYGSIVVLYTCTDGKAFGGLPAPVAHPCGRAAKALDDAGHAYELRKVKGGSLKVWTWPSRARDRAEIEKLSGQRAVPILVLDGGEVLTGSGAIVYWARENRP